MISVMSDSGVCDGGAVDAVVTWVDGADADHKSKRRAALAAAGNRPPSLIRAGTDQTRFEDNNEIEFCLKSIRKFAPWIRTIYLVTDRQCPSFLNDESKRRLGVEMIDHEVIFSGHEDVLPTFNSLSIETALHRIPGLSSRFIYFNDDFILTSPVQVQDFFSSNGVVLRGGWKRIQRFGKTRLALSKALNLLMKELFGINRAMSMLQQIRGAVLAGAARRYFKVAHVPYPMRRQTLEEFYRSNPDVFMGNISYKFRSLYQYAETSLANHIEILDGSAILESPDDHIMICFNRDFRFEIEKKIEILASGRVKFLCLQSFEQASRTHRREIEGIIRKVLA